MDKGRQMLTDTQWHRIETLLPSQQGKQGRPRKSDRLIIEGILWSLRTGAPWERSTRKIWCLGNNLW